MTDERYRQKAKEEHEKEGECEIDDGAVVSRGSDPGAYVQAWVWVYSDANEASDGDDQQGSDEDTDRENGGPCMTCKATMCDHEGMCPRCSRDEAITALLKTMGDFGTQDIYTDAREYEGRTLAARKLSVLCAHAAAGKPISVLDVQLILENGVN